MARIAGVNIPLLDDLEFHEETPDLFETDAWMDRGVETLKLLMRLHVERQVMEEQHRLLGEELRTTTQRVNLFEKVIKKVGGLKNNLTTQKNFLIKMGIEQRAELISKNQSFSKKVNIYFRLKRLIDEKQMGNLFKVMLIKNRKSKFKLGFQN